MPLLCNRSDLFDSRQDWQKMPLHLYSPELLRAELEAIDFYRARVQVELSEHIARLEKLRAELDTPEPDLDY